MGNIIGAPKILRLLNKDVIERVIQENGPVTKQEIAKETNLSPVTVRKTVELLLNENKIRVNGDGKAADGGKEQLYEINRELNCNIVLLYGRNMLTGVVADCAGNTIYEEEFQIRPALYEEVMEDTFHAADSLFGHCGNHEVTAIGVGVPGLVKAGVVTGIPDIPGWESVKVSQVMEQKYGVRVFVENDINLATMGIYSDSYKNTIDNLMVIYMDKGIGSGIILNRELFKGSSNFAGEISFMPSSGQSRLQDELSFIAGKMKTGEEPEKWKECLLKTLCSSLLCIACVLNPEIVVIQYKRLEEADMRRLEEMLADYIDEEHVPRLVKVDSLKQHSIRGIINMGGQL